jgi:hypothetical protein
MAKDKQLFDPEKAHREIIALIDNFFTLSKSKKLRSKVLALIPAFHLLRQLGKSIISSDMTISARQRILTYLKRYTLTIIDSEELMVVSGITDYQRRIRELRVQFGWPILSGTTVKNMHSEVNGR